MKKLLSTLAVIFLAMSVSAQQEPSTFLQTTDDGRMQLTRDGASHFAQLALGCIQQEYPNKLNQVLPDNSQLKEPHELHPAFFGCFDWHSSVHGHWMLVRLLRQYPDLPEGEEIRRKLSENLTEKNIQGEVEYFEHASKSWERMYGWAWLLKLAEELYTWDDAQGKQWSKNLQPLADAITERYLAFLPVQAYPVRTGVHPNTAFGLSFAWDYANTTGHQNLKTLIEKRAKDYYLTDTDCPANWEPSGEDFLSACLEEANLMRRILPKEMFQQWFKRFLPKKRLAALASPADVSDRSDPKIVHLDGLNLSRAWCLYGISPLLKKKSQRKMMLTAAKNHLEVTVPNIASEHYAGSHWLASFVVMAMGVE